jgi:polysaccharide deacetylase 2 family uncharacterized protein YibQ
VAAKEAEEYQYGLPALREERRPGGLMVAYGLVLALVVGAAALAFGYLGTERRGATLRTPPSGLATPSDPAQANAAASQSMAPQPPAPEIAAAPPASSPRGGGLQLPTTTAPTSPPTITPGAPPPVTGSLKLPPRPAAPSGKPSQPTAAPPTTPPATPPTAGLVPPGRPLIQSLPDPATPGRQNGLAWNPLASNGMPAPPPEKPTPPASFRALPPVDTTEMIEVTADGLRLPKVSPAGWMPWIAYARRYSPDGPPARVGLLMINVGANEPMMKRAIEQLPGEVSLAFLPGTPDLNRWLQRARDYGHEVYLMLPVEDPGGPAERGLKPIETSVEAAENLRRLRATMAKGEGYVGVVLPFPGPVSQSEATFRPIMKELSERGLAVVEINAAHNAPVVYRLTVEMGVGYARNSSVLDYKANRQNIDENLDRMVRWVREAPAGQDNRGQDSKKAARHAFGVVQPNAASIEAIADWSKRLSNTPDVSFLPIIGHFECREACMMRVRRLQALLRQ